MEQNLNMINRPAMEEEKLREEESKELEDDKAEESEAEVMGLFRDEEQEEGGGGWCMKCVHKPCLCLLNILEGRIRNLREAEKVETEEEDEKDDPEPHDHLALEVPDQGELPGQGNSTHNPGISPGRVGAYNETHQESNASWEAGHLAELIVERGGQVHGVEERRKQEEEQSGSVEERI